MQRELREVLIAGKLAPMESSDPTLDSIVELFRSLPHVLFCVKRPDGSYQHANRAFAVRCGKKHELDVVDCRAVDLFPSELARSYEAQDQAVLATGRPVTNQLELISRHDGSLGWFLTSKSPVFGPEGIAAVMVVSIDLNAASTNGDALGNLAAVVDRVRAEPEKSWRVSELATLSGLGIRQLERRMQRVLGVGAKQFLQMTRVDLAARLLTTSSMALGVVADQCGYYDQSQFSREFRLQTGMTPGKYRSLVS
jgi:AraC-like DNA-binding protein